MFSVHDASTSDENKQNRSLVLSTCPQCTEYLNVLGDFLIEKPEEQSQKPSNLTQTMFFSSRIRFGKADF